VLTLRYQRQRGTTRSQRPRGWRRRGERVGKDVILGHSVFIDHERIVFAEELGVRHRLLAHVDP